MIKPSVIFAGILFTIGSVTLSITMFGMSALLTIAVSLGIIFGLAFLRFVLWEASKDIADRLNNNKAIYGTYFRP